MKALPLLLILAGCSTPCCGAPDGEAKAVEDAVRGMYEAFKGKSLAGVGPFMTDDSTCYDVYTSQLLVGRQAVLDHFGAILARHKPDEKWQSSLEDMKVAVTGATAVATYKVRTSEPGGGHMLAAVTHVFAKGADGRWRAAHLHRSWNSPPAK